jgi:hypothetical protein
MYEVSKLTLYAEAVHSAKVSGSLCLLSPVVFSCILRAGSAVLLVPTN